MSGTSLAPVTETVVGQETVPLPVPVGADAATGWLPVCRLDDLVPERGVAALVGGTQVAVFRTFDDRLHALGNQDPFTGAFVLSRGIVGSRGAAATVASPLHKQVFDLVTGICLDDDAVAVPVYGVRGRDGLVELAVG
ncbi:MAG: nitrite reductase small subunit NirD [Frankia sp.]